MKHMDMDAHRYTHFHGNLNLLYFLFFFMWSYCSLESGGNSKENGKILQVELVNCKRKCSVIPTYYFLFWFTLSFIFLCVAFFGLQLFVLLRLSLSFWITLSVCPLSFSSLWTGVIYSHSRGSATLVMLFFATFSQFSSVHRWFPGFFTHLHTFF